MNDEIIYQLLESLEKLSKAMTIMYMSANKEIKELNLSVDELTKQIDQLENRLSK